MTTKCQRFRKIFLCSIIGGFVCIFLNGHTHSQQDDNFVFTQLHYRGGDWDPHPTSFQEIVYFLMATTSIKALQTRRVLSLTDTELFSSPFLCMAGHRGFDPFTEEEIEILRNYLTGGGLLFIDDSIGQKNYGFDRAVRRELQRVFPDKELTKLPHDHAVFFTFYLKPKASGRRIVNPYLEGITFNNKTVVIYSQNDLLGAWARDKLGNWMYDCIPGGEVQRMEAIKLLMNILLYNVTGSYKKDAVHQPFIMRKMKTYKR